jgi:hypothetical protein
MASPSEREEISRIVGRVSTECPGRRATSDAERLAALIAGEELGACGCRTEEQRFRFTGSIHQNYVLHFGLGALGTAVGGVSPPLAALLHGVASASFWYDGTHRGFLLRRLLTFRDSQNVIATLPAEGEARRRIVLLAHVDAPFTGLVMRPWFARRLAERNRPRWRLLGRPAELATKAEAAAALLDAIRAAVPPLALPLRPLELLLGLPGLLVFLSNLEIALRAEVSPGANDNLSAVAALCVLARRLATSRPRDVEIVFVATGCEEAGWGGAKALERERAGAWDRERTVVVALDCLGNGQLRYVRAEGEVRRIPVPEPLERAVREVAASDPRFAGVTGFDVPIGGTDATPFLARGWRAVGLVAVDPDIGAPRHYHLPTDTLDRLDLDEVLLAVDFTEKLVRTLAAESR